MKKDTCLQQEVNTPLAVGPTRCRVAPEADLGGGGAAFTLVPGLRRRVCLLHSAYGLRGPRGASEQWAPHPHRCSNAAGAALRRVHLAGGEPNGLSAARSEAEASKPSPEGRPPGGIRHRGADGTILQALPQPHLDLFRWLFAAGIALAAEEPAENAPGFSAPSV